MKTDMIEIEMFSRITAALLECGIPAKATFNKMVVDVGSRHHYCVDMLVAAEDGKTPQCVVEVKDGILRPSAYRQARQQLAGILSTFSCFVVTRESDAKIYVAKICYGQVKNEAWVELSDIASLKALLGDYCSGSKEIVAKNQQHVIQFAEEQLKHFRICLGIGAGVAFAVMFIFECATGRGVSYSLAGVTVFALLLYAASYGLIREVKIKGVGTFSFWAQDDKDLEPRA